MKYLLTLWVIVVIALHQDFWNWTNKTLVLGFLPIGLAYHAGYSLLAAATMAVMVQYLWPKELEEVEGGGPDVAGAGVPRRPLPVVAGPGEANRP